MVDNNSSDDSVQYVKANYPEVHIVKNEKNLGFAGGCNIGVKSANGEYLVILNNDTTQEKHWLSQLVKFMEEHPSVGVAQPKLLNAKEPTIFDYSGAAGGFMDKYAFPFARGRIYDSVEEDHGQYNTPIPIFWASGTACILRKEIVAQIGLFDETFFAHMEEIDFNWRVHLSGWDIWSVPQSVIYHHSGFTLPPESPFKKYLNHRNSLYMLLANYSFYHLICKGFQRLLLDMGALVFTLLQKEFDRSRAILQSWGWIMTHPNKIWAKRRIVRKIRELSDSEMKEKLYQASIALEYFLFRKNRWDEKRHTIDSEKS
jgi:hypothetical protein